MLGALIPFVRRPAGRPARSDWTQAELSEFYRVEAQLIAAGMRVQTDRGVSDEGDPWLVFCHDADQQDVVIHFARLNGSYLVSAPDMEAMRTDTDFRRLVQDLLGRYAQIAKTNVDQRAGKSGAVVLHPAAVLWTLIAVAFLKTAEARAFTGSQGGQVTGHVESSGAVLGPLPENGGSGSFAAVATYAMQSVMIAWATTIGIGGNELHAASAEPLEAWLHVAAPVVALASLAESSAYHTVASAPLETSGSPAPPHWTDGASILGHDADAPVWMGQTAATGSVHEAAAPVPPGAHVDLVALGAAFDHSVHPVHVTEAGEALSAAAAAAGVGEPAITLVVDLPATITTVLSHALHVANATTATSTDAAAAVAELNLAAASAAPEGTPDSDTALPPAPNHQTDHQTFDHAVTIAVSTPSSSPGSPMTSLPAPVQPDPIPPHVDPAVTSVSLGFAGQSGPHAPPSAAQDQATLALAISSVHEFLLEVSQAKTVSTANTVVVYDPAAIDVALSQAQAITFDFSDGSHIGLIGLPSELTHALQGHP